jgi:hypothetical protein
LPQAAQEYAPLRGECFPTTTPSCILIIR